MKKKAGVLQFIVLIMLIIFSALSIVMVKDRTSEFEAEKSELDMQIEAQSERVEKLKYELSLPDEEYIKKYAREVLRYHKSGEIVFYGISK